MEKWQNRGSTEFMTFLLLWHSLVWLGPLECNDVKMSYWTSMSMTSVFLLITLLKQLRQVGSSSQPQLCCLFLQRPHIFPYKDSNGFWISPWDAKIWHIVTCEHQKKCKESDILMAFLNLIWMEKKSTRKSAPRKLMFSNPVSSGGTSEIVNTFTNCFLAYFGYIFPICYAWSPFKD